MISPQSFPRHLGVKYLQIANTVKLRQRPTGNREGVKGEQTGCLQLSTKATTWLQIIPKVVSRYLVISNETWIYIVLCNIDRLVQSKLITNLVCDLKEWEGCIGLFRFSGAGELVNWINGEQRVALADINHSGRCSELTDWIWRL